MRPLDLDAHCQARGKPFFDLMFEPADGTVRDPNALQKDTCLFHAGDGYAGAADNRSDFPPPQYSRVHQHFDLAVFLGQRNRNEKGFAGVSLNKKMA